MNEEENILGFFDILLLQKRIFNLKMEELFAEPSTYEDEIED